MTDDEVPLCEFGRSQLYMYGQALERRAGMSLQIGRMKKGRGGYLCVSSLSYDRALQGKASFPQHVQYFIHQLHLVLLLDCRCRRQRWEDREMLPRPAQRLLTHQAVSGWCSLLHGMAGWKVIQRQHVPLLPRIIIPLAARLLVFLRRDQVQEAKQLVNRKHRAMNVGM